MLVIDRMSILICYNIIMGPVRFFLPGAHSMLKPALPTNTNMPTNFLTFKCRYCPHVSYMKYHIHTFSYIVPNVWNVLPASIISIHSNPLSLHISKLTYL